MSTVDFGLDGVTYEIDLDDKNETRLREALADYVAAARRTGGRRTGTRRPTTTTATAGAPARPQNGGRGSAPIDRAQAQAIREWARTQGMSVSERGRIPAKIVDAYQRAH